MISLTQNYELVQTILTEIQTRLFRRSFTFFLCCFVMAFTLRAQDANFGQMAVDFYNQSQGADQTTSVGSSEYQFNGKGAGDQFGVTVSSAGDVNGDGLSDTIIRSYGNNEIATRRK